MSRGLKILARELDVPVLAISQLSRAPEQRTPPQARMLSDLRESGSIEQDADLVAFLYREDYYRDHEDEPDGLADVIIAKHRNGPIGSRKLVFLDRFPKFADFSGYEQPVEQPAGRGPADGGQGGGGAGVLMAIARCEPFREAACPLGVCDGSGWILGPEDVARPCDCREQRLAKGRSARRRLGDPAALPRGLVRAAAGLRHGEGHEEPQRGRRDVREYVDDLDTKLETGNGLWLLGGTGTGKTTLGMLMAKTALAAGKTVAVYFTPKLLTQIRQTYQASERRGRLRRLLQAAHLGRPPLHRRPRLRAPHRLGGRAALRAGQRALRERALDARHQQRLQSRPGHRRGPQRARGADRIAHGLPPGRDVRRPPAPVRDRRTRDQARAVGE